MLSEVKRQLGLPVLTDVHEDTPMAEVASSRRCAADTGVPGAADQLHPECLLAAARPVNIKKGQFLSPWEMQNVVDKARSTGNEQIMVCERGFSFGYNNLVSDMRSLSVMRATGWLRSCSTPRTRCSCRAARAHASGGQREFVPVLARAAVAAGVSGVFMETHP